MKTQYGKKGHAYVRFYDRSSATARYVHRLVLEAFVSPCPEGLEGCHEDGNPRNNHVGNLRWDSHKGNMADKERHGTRYTGERVGTAKLTADEVRRIRTLREKGMPETDIAALFGVCQQNINLIVNRKTWGHIA